MRFFAIAISLFLFASSAVAVEVVLRDTIGPDGSNTSDTNSMYAHTNLDSAAFSSPGVRVTNTSSKVGDLKEVRTVVLVEESTGNPSNDLQRAKQIAIQFHAWQDGLEGTGDTFDEAPWSGQASLLIDYASNASLEVLSTGNSNGYDTFLLTIDVTSLDIELHPGQEIVFSTVQTEFVLQPDVILMSFSRSFYQVDDNFVEDIYQSITTRLEHRPGYVLSQLEVNGFNYGAYASIEFLEADFDSDGDVDGDDFLEWQSNFGSSGNAPWESGDGDGDGDTDGDDFLVWQSQFGMTLDDLGAAGNAAGAVPEPSACVLLLTLAASFRIWVARTVGRERR